MADRKLTPRQEKFINAYLLTGNATKSALESGYSPKTASSIGEENLKKTEIHALIEQRNRRLTKKAEISQERLLTEFLRLGLSNMADYVTWDAEGNVTVKPSDELTRGQKAAIKKIESDRVTTVTEDGHSETRSKLKIELYPKEGSLTKLGEKYGLFPRVKEGDQFSFQVNNYQKSHDPFDVSALSVAEQQQFLALLRKAKPVTVVGEGKT